MDRITKPRAAIVAALFWALASGPGGAVAAGPRPASDTPARATTDTTVVGMTNTLEFDPAEVTVHVGDTVVWRNTSDLIHTVTDDPSKAVKRAHAGLPEGAEPWDSGQLKPGEAFSRTFSMPGEYRYFCIPHEAAGMTGVVKVLPR